MRWAIRWPTRSCARCAKPRTVSRGRRSTTCSRATNPRQTSPARWAASWRRVSLSACLMLPPVDGRQSAGMQYGRVSTHTPTVRKKRMKRTNSAHGQLSSSLSFLSSPADGSGRGRPVEGAALRNAIDPDQIPAESRLQQVASLLAAGFLRWWLHKADQGADGGLAILRTSSEVCVCPPQAGQPSSAGEMSL